MPRLLIVPKFSLCLIIERAKQVKRDVGRLKVSRIGVGNVVA
jgi:hypothetical protein